MKYLKKCSVGGNKHLTKIISLYKFPFTGIFNKTNKLKSNSQSKFK